MKITTQNELAALLAGVYLGHGLGLGEESSGAGGLNLGNFEDINARIHRGEDIEPISYDSETGHYAVVGALYEAERRAAELWEQWSNDAGEAYNKVKLRGFKNEG